MTSEIWQAVAAIVEDALELSPPQRAAFIERACEGRPDVAREVHSLLEAGRAAGDFLECHTVDSAPPPDEPAASPIDERIGPYRIVEEVGHGGMSIVYRAERDDGQFQKIAAIKLLATGWISPDAMRRFLAERQILATLDHPNICRLLDGGVAGGGAPYLVMEFVDGVRLLDYCRDRKLGERERLQLFRCICQAVQFAHQNLIVHRDIKPGNVLVTHTGEVKLMDFGIAKILGGGGERDGTQTGFAAMTPDYASPEQVKSQPITMQSDIYSLGVLLYELLTERRPYAASGKPIETLLEIVGGSEPPPVPGLPAELLAIVRCAMCRDPGGRYAAASALEDDIKRYLSGMPVRALSPSRWYILRKWMGRHRTSVLAGTAAAILILSTSALAWRSAVVAQRERAAAEQRFSQVRRLAEQAIFVYPRSLGNIGIATDLQVRMATDSLQYLDSLASVRSSDWQLSLELIDAYMRVSKLLGASRNNNLGDKPKALEALRKARPILEDLLKRQPWLRPARVRMARFLCDMADLDAANSQKLNQQSLELLQGLYRQDPSDRETLRGLIQTHLALAVIDGRGLHPGQAIEFAEAWLARLSDLSVAAGDRADETRQALENLAYARRLLAWSLLKSNKYVEALAESEKARAADERAMSRLSNEGANPMHMSLNLNLIATCYFRMNDLARARDFFRRTTSLQRKALLANRNDAFVRNRFLGGLAWEGWTAERQGDLAGARSIYQEAANVASSVTIPHSDSDWNWVLGFVYGSQGLMIKHAGQRSAGCELLQQAAGYYRATSSLDDDFGRRAAEVNRELAGCRSQPR